MAKLNQAGIKELLASEEVKQTAVQHADRVLDTAQRIAPVQTGAYRASLHVVETDKGAAVVAGVDYARDVEANHGTLARALNMTPKE